ncbi:hypothetical protein BT96DRAFT_112275 [Gymnopus androsaceus JB14]|uniref:Uncharacterized protein n=1 Tax=Gymnopus androsaceus JB14 TaxID=1447944 RepID=A0A6A4GC75_9AGAR|nr:hypothetical protein BT96DRAFT_112275 [Gymnopus androsaceus JB14]
MQSPNLDPYGWSTFSPVDCIGSLLNSRTVVLRCTLSLATPPSIQLSYTLHSFLVIFASKMSMNKPWTSSPLQEPPFSVHATVSDTCTMLVMGCSKIGRLGRNTKYPMSVKPFGGMRKMRMTLPTRAFDT